MLFVLGRRQQQKRIKGGAAEKGKCISHARDRLKVVLRKKNDRDISIKELGLSIIIFLNFPRKFR